MPINSAACHHLILPDVARNNTSCNFIAPSAAVVDEISMLVCMDPSSPPVKRTLHLLKTPDILLANDSGLLGSYLLANISAARDHKTRQVFDCCSGIHRACLSFIFKQ